MSEFTFGINYNKHKNTLFIVDEASMISNRNGEGTEFGSGRLLDDLFEYVYSGDNCFLMLMGDTAQLLPVGEQHSPALDAGELKRYGMTLFTSQLTEVIRQDADSGILFNATLLRQLIDEQLYGKPKFNLSFPDVKRIGGQDLIDALNSSYNEVGYEESKIRSEERRVGQGCMP